MKLQEVLFPLNWLPSDFGPKPRVQNLEVCRTVMFCMVRERGTLRNKLNPDLLQSGLKLCILDRKKNYETAFKRIRGQALNPWAFATSLELGTQGYVPYFWMSLIFDFGWGIIWGRFQSPDLNLLLWGVSPSFDIELVADAQKGRAG